VTSLLLIGCAKSSSKVSDVSDQPAPSVGELPENDCLGLSAQQVQKFCGSGALERTISLIQNGYQCVYSALDPMGSDRPRIGTELALTYFTSGDDLVTLKGQVKSNNPAAAITDSQNGFYAITPTTLALDRAGQQVEIYQKTGALTIFIAGTDLDYEVIDDDPDKACSLNELQNISSFISGSGATAERQDTSTVPGTVEKDSNCCEIIVAKVTGAVETKTGDRVASDMRLAVGDKLYTVDAQLIIGVVCDDDPTNVKMFVIEADEPTEISIEVGADGQPTVSQDPGTATVSIKELPAFATDFQVSTPRLTCSVRG